MRVLAHELRQPLSTIESIAYYLTLILPDDEKVREQLDRIQQLVEQSNWMLTSGQFICDSLPAAHEPVDLRDLIGHLNLDGFAVEIAGDISLVHADSTLLKATLENLLMLFRQFSAHTVFRITGSSIDLTAAVTGYRSEGSLGPGSTLSIQGARRVVESCGGSLTVEIDPESGIKLRVMLP